MKQNLKKKIEKNINGRDKINVTKDKRKNLWMLD